jgi:hypothetical protein
MMAFKKTAFLTLLFILFLLTPARALQKSETLFFNFYYEKESLLISSLIKNADPATLKVKELTGFVPKEKIDVFIAADKKEFKRFQPKNAQVPDWAVGVAFPSQNLIILLKKKNTGFAPVFRHELNHILLGQAFKGKEKVPRWLDEGLAMIMAGEWNLSSMAAMTGAVLTGAVLPMEDITTHFPYEESRARIAYAQSFYFISFLKGKFGDSSFKRFLTEYSKYHNFNLAIRKTYFLDWWEVEDMWRQYLRLRFNWIPIITSTGFLWFVTSIIFVIGYFHKKRKSRLKLKQWEEEEKFIYDDQEDENTLH